MAILDVSDVTKRFGAVTAVDGVSFRVGPGEVVGLLGPNGAGKTTTLHMVLGLVTPDAGEVRLFGERLDGDRRRCSAGSTSPPAPARRPARPAAPRAVPASGPRRRQPHRLGP